MQVAATLAVGEAVSSTATGMNPATFHRSLSPSLPQALEFEHRDLHRSNVLVKKTHDQNSVYFRLHNKDYLISTHGVMATIVDYTLSRIRQGNPDTTIQSHVYLQ